MNQTLALSLARPLQTRFGVLLSDVLLVLAGSLVVAMTAQIAIPLPFTPVPITGQTFGVMVVAAALGSKRGALAMLTYIAEGAMGLPFFAGGMFGIAHLMGPTGGYLWGFVLAAFAMGAMAERGYDRSWKTALPAFFVGQLVIFAVGVPWLATFVGWDKALMAGLFPFILGQIVKTVLASAALPSAWSVANRE